MKSLDRTQFGNPILRRKTSEVAVNEIKSKKIQSLIESMHYTLEVNDIGIGLAAPQVGIGLAIAAINIHPTSLRSNVEKFKLTIINPKIIKFSGRKVAMWEGCISSGSLGKADLFAKVPRYSKIKVNFYDEDGAEHTEDFIGLQAQVIQHEVDHLNGTLFVDRVVDTKT